MIACFVFQYGYLATRRWEKKKQRRTRAAQQRELSARAHLKEDPRCSSAVFTYTPDSCLHSQSLVIARDPVSETPMFVPAVDHGDASLALGGFAEMLIASRAIFSTSENP
jgi:acyl-CoA thioesterase